VEGGGKSLQRSPGELELLQSVSVRVLATFDAVLEGAGMFSTYLALHMIASTHGIKGSFNSVSIVRLCYISSTYY
jgi:hypothetical protein